MKSFCSHFEIVLFFSEFNYILTYVALLILYNLYIFNELYCVVCVCLIHLFYLLSYQKY